jgi:hypothetical protein
MTPQQMLACLNELERTAEIASELKQQLLERLKEVDPAA